MTNSTARSAPRWTLCVALFELPQCPPPGGRDTAAPHRRDQPHVAPIGGLSMLLNFMVVNIVYKLAPVSNADSRFP